jgi:hypothetical protein
MRRLVPLAAFALASCTLVLDGSRHQGGDDLDGGGPLRDGGDAATPDAGCDRDEDTYLAVACGGDDCDDGDPNVYPNAAPICGNEQVEGCPGDTLVPVAFFGGVAAGRLPEVLLAGEAEGYGDDLALAAVPLAGGGLGTAVVLLLEGPDAEGRTARRYDVPLDDLEAAVPTSIVSSGSDDLSTTPFTSLALDGSGSAQVGAVLQGALRSYEGYFDLIAGDPGLYRRGFEGSWGEAAIVGQASIFRSMGDTDPVIRGSRIVPPPSLFQHEGPEVPTGEVRTVTTDVLVMLQPEDERFLFWGQQDEPLGELEALGQTGRASLVTLPGPIHGFGRAYGARVEIDALECDRNLCQLAVLTGGRNVIRTGADSAEVLAAGGLANASSVFLLLERHADGDRLSLQPVGVDLEGLPHPRIPLLDRRGTGERMHDAVLDVLESPTGTTVLVGAVVGDGETGARVVLTGVRSCATD